MRWSDFDNALPAGVGEMDLGVVFQERPSEFSSIAAAEGNDRNE